MISHAEAYYRLHQQLLAIESTDVILNVVDSSKAGIAIRATSRSDILGPDQVGSGVPFRSVDIRFDGHRANWATSAQPTNPWIELSTVDAVDAFAAMIEGELILQKLARSAKEKAR